MIRLVRGFRDFIMRGNVVDLAVGIVIGASFTTLVGTFTTSFLEPTLQLVGAEENQIGGAWEFRNVVFEWSAFVNAFIAFLLTAALLYILVVVPMNRIARRRSDKADEARSQEIRLLTEIRDALHAGGLPRQRDHA